MKTYGSGTPGTGGHVPTLWPTTTPRPGDATFAVDVGNALGGSAGALFLSLQRGSLNVAGVEVLVDLPTALNLATFPLSGAGPGNGTARVPLPLPNAPALLSFDFHLQAFVADAGGPWVGISATPGLTLRPQRNALLLVTRSVGGSPDAQYAIDLATGTVADFAAGRVDNGQGVAIDASGTRAFVCSALNHSVQVYDVTSFPGSHLLGYGVQVSGTMPWSITLNPDGRRAYVVTQGPGTTTPAVEVFDADPGSATFGQPFPGGGFPAGSISALTMHFTPDGDVGFLSSLGVGGPAGVTRYDTRIGSPTYHQPTGSYTAFGHFLFVSAISPDGSIVFAGSAQPGQTAEIAVIHAQSMLQVDWDPGAPGVQNIGGEQSRPQTPTNRTLGGMAVDPRGRWLWYSCSGSVAGPAQLVRVDIDPASAQYQQFATYTTGLPSTATLAAVVVSDAGDRVYLAVTSAGTVHEIDAVTLNQLRTFSVASANQLALR